MSSVMHPVGDKPPNVYWRRRVVAIVALVVVLLLVFTLVRAIAGLFGGSSTATTSPSAGAAPATSSSSAPATASASATASGDGSTPCDPASIKVTPTSEARSVKADGSLKIGMLIENVGQTACTLDAGSANLELLITSGGERIWSSDDCQKGGENRPTVLQPAAKLESSVPWEVTRSAANCATGLSKVQSGTYQLKARVGDINSDSLTFQVKPAA